MPNGGIVDLPRPTMTTRSSAAPDAPRWITSNELYRLLRLSHTTVRQLRKERVLLPGDHYIAKGTGPKPPLLWDYAAVEAALRARTRALPEVYDQE